MHMYSHTHTSTHIHNCHHKLKLYSEWTVNTMTMVYTVMRLVEATQSPIATYSKKRQLIFSLSLCYSNERECTNSEPS